MILSKKWNIGQTQKNVSSFPLLQTSSNRNPVNEYIQLSKYDFAWGANNSAEKSHLLIVLSNYIWLREHSDNKDELHCTPNDFRVTLKLASTGFSPVGKTSKESSSSSTGHQYSFDTSGASFELGEFLEFTSSKQLEAFISRVRKLSHDSIKVSQKPAISSADADGGNSLINAEISDDDEDQPRIVEVDGPIPSGVISAEEGKKLKRPTFLNLTSAGKSSKKKKL